MRRIKLTKGKYAIIDDEDFEKVSTRKWSMHSAGYATSGGSVLLHRFIMNAKPGTMIDHIDRNKLNNRKCNLRFCNYVTNAQNQKRRSDSTYGTGVSFDKRRNKFFAQVWINKKKKFLGYFETAQAASKKYVAFTEENFSKGV